MFEREYVHVMHMKYPDGTREDVVMSGVGLDEFATNAFMAGFRFARTHEDWKPKGNK